MRKKEQRSEKEMDAVIDQTLRTLLSDQKVTVRDALSVPSIAGCVELISGTIAGLPVRLFESSGGVITERKQDYRLGLLNHETGDLLDAHQWKKALIRDYLLPGNGYSYVSWKKNQIEGIHYIDPVQVSVNINADPIFKVADFLVGGIRVAEYCMFRILRHTRDGVTGRGVVNENDRAISTMVDGILYERSLFRTGARKGFLKSDRRLTDDAISRLSNSIRRLFSNDGESVTVLNKGIEYQPAGQTAVETQLNENKTTNGREVCRMFCLSPKLFEGGATAEDRRMSAVYGIIPVVKALISALNRFCLLESEKDHLFFSIDTDELLEGGMLERYQSYEIAARNGLMQIDEMRNRENMSPLGLNFIKLGLDTVLYDPQTKQIYTPNTDKLSNLTEGKTLGEEGEGED